MKTDAVKTDEIKADEAKWLSTFPEWAPIAIIELDFNFKVTYINPAGIVAFPNIYDDSHPAKAKLHNIHDHIEEDSVKNLTREVMVGNILYLQYITIVSDLKIIRIFCINLNEVSTFREEFQIDLFTGAYNEYGFRKKFISFIEDPAASDDDFMIIRLNLKLQEANSKVSNHGIDLNAVQTLYQCLKDFCRLHDVIARLNSLNFVILMSHVTRSHKSRILTTLERLIINRFRLKSSGSPFAIRMGGHCHLAKETPNLDQLIALAEKDFKDYTIA